MLRCFDSIFLMEPYCNCRLTNCKARFLACNWGFLYDMIIKGRAACQQMTGLLTKGESAL